MGCVRLGSEEYSRKVIFFLGVFDESSIWALSDGYIGKVCVIGPDVRWCLVDSIRSEFVKALSVAQTR